MLRSSLIISVLTLVLAACSDGADSTGKPAASTEEAMRVAATPFSVGDSTENEMGAAPPNELSVGNGDPYEQMARAQNVDAPSKTEMAQ